MKVRVVLMVAFALSFAIATFGQEEKIELTGDYSYFRFNPGLPSLWNSQSLNGGGGQATLDRNRRGSARIRERYTVRE